MKENKREIIITSDGSHTISVPEVNAAYHSRYGAIQESMHVFIKAGLHYVTQHYAQQIIKIFEMGFGTGLNALLSLIEGEKLHQTIHYTAIELYPIAEKETVALNYDEVLQIEKSLFQKLHNSDWNKQVSITNHFRLLKEQTDLANYTADQLFHLIYYDAFAPAAQPELWTVDIFKKMYSLLHSNGVLVTYCSKGDVRRAMIAAGFTVKKLPGPPGRREILRAIKE
ncbi:MAG TPA: tRNA (5-methylaminomethyl-2-thiouridine)(34)-methyltransferase MnmD [Flavisolibacter sp.]|nr:tRNA (5-methylaminomethyl-2-thiouridine)(34)-methyltransferase MnmD [Flavisolibacter sp.]